MRAADPRTLRVRDFLPCRVAATGSLPGSLPVNLVNAYGMSGLSDPTDLHDNHSSGNTMWLGRPAPNNESGLTFDFGCVVPVGEMWIWNHNQGTGACGIRDVRVLTSVDSRRWNEMAGPGSPYRLRRAAGADGLAATNLEGGEPIRFHGLGARYVRILPSGPRGEGNWGGSDDEGMLVGLSEVRFYAGQGLAAHRAQEWADLFRRSEGWTGADGIFSIPFDGDERPRGLHPGDDEPDAASRTLFLFSDTFVGSIHPVTQGRLFTMLNNTLGVLTGAAPVPGRMRFVFRTDAQDRPGTVFDPVGTDHFKLAGEHYLWLQDGIVIHGTLHVTGLNVYHDPAGAEGMAFRVGAVSLIQCPMGLEGPDIDAARIAPTPLAFDAHGAGHGYYGCGVFPNTASAGSPAPDEYIYVYGYINRGRRSDLIVARVRPEDFAAFEHWRYRTEDGWSPRPEESAVVAENVSHELSVSPYWGRLHEGRYILVFQRDIAGPIVGYRIGESPYGPFGESRDIFHADEWEAGQGIMSYNAKAHPHLSRVGELLVSYNVNSVSTQTHRRNGDVYRPRFLWLREVVDVAAV